MRTTIQQLEDLKEWAQDSTRYERRLAFRGGQLVQPGPGRPGYAGDDHHSFKPLTTATEKAHYERQYGKKYNVDDWKKGNFTKKEKFSSGKKKVKRDPMWKRADFRKSLKNYLKQETGFTDLAKRGYISISQLNKLLGGKDTQQAIDTLSSGLKHSPWVEEIEGVKKWKKSRLQTELSMIDEGGKVFYKMPDKETLKGLKSYYKNQEYLSDFKEGRIKGNTIKNVQTLYDDDTLMKAIKKWTIKDKKVPLTIIKAVFGEGTTGPSSVMQLGRALKGDIKIPGVRKNVALGNKIIEAMAWESRKGRGPWQNAMYEYAKAEMDNLYKTKGKEWNFGKYYRETRNLLNKLGVKDVIDEVSALRSGWTNNNQIYSTFKQVIDKKINDSFKSGYDARFSTSQGKVQKLLADKPPGWQDEVKRLTGLQEGAYKRAKLKYPKIEFATFGEFDETTGKFAKPEKVFGKRFAELPSEIQKGIRKSFRDTGVSLNVGQTKTQQELFKTTLNRLEKELPDIFKAYQKSGIGGHCRAYGGRIGFEKAGAVNMSKCMTKAIEDNKKAMGSTDESVRAAAIFKNRQAVNNAKKIPAIGKLIRQGIQKGKSSLGWLLGGANIPIEALIEGGIYEYYRREGYTHDQAFAETFTPRLLKEGAEGKSTEDVPWYGGAEKLLEEDLYKIKGENEFLDVDNRPPMQDPEFGQVIGERKGVKRYLDNMVALDEVTSEYYKIQDHLTAIQSGRTRVDPETVERLQIRLKELEAEGIRLNNLIKEGSSDEQLYQTQLEKQQTEQGQRAIEWGEYGQGDTPELARRREEERYRLMNEKFPGYHKAAMDKRLEEWGYYMDPDLRSYKGKTVERPEGLKFIKGWTYDDFSDYLKDQDKMAYFAENFRTEKAGGGIANVRRPSAIPPESGPMPQGGGLSSQFNRVRKLTG